MKPSTRMQARRIPTEKQPLLFSEDSLLPEKLPSFSELEPSLHLMSIFEDCHNYIYANEGLLKNQIFQEIVKLLVMKWYDEQNSSEGIVQFGITASEYRDILSGASSTFTQRISNLYTAIKKKFPNFFQDVSLRLRPLTLAYIVRQLQYISLTKTPGDCKGEAFQTFVHHHQRGERGEFFTPYPIVKLAVEMLAPAPSERIIDPACGSGGFLLQAISYIQRVYPEVDKSAYIRANICGIEINPDVALSATLRLIFEGGSGTEIICANALVEKENMENAFDIVLTNPPFGSKGKVEDPQILKHYALAYRWKRAHHDNYWKRTETLLPGQSPEILFIEKSLRLLRPGGRMAIVLPDGLLQNVSNEHVRFWIRSQAKVLGVVSIPQEAFVPYGTGIKTSLLLLQKLPAASYKACFMARMQKIGYDVKGQPIYKRDESGKTIKTLSGLPVVDSDVEEIVAAFNNFRKGALSSTHEHIYVVFEDFLNSRLDAEHYQPGDHHLLQRLQSMAAKPLGELADILSETDDFRLISNGEIRYIAISDVDPRIMQVVSQQTIKAHEAPSRATYRVRAGDIITAISGASTGTPKQASALITEDEDGAICSNGFAVLRNIRGVHPLFLLAYMRTEYYWRQVRRLMTGHAIPSLSLDALSKILVPIPDEQEQRRIADSLMNTQAMYKKALKTSEMIEKETEAVINRLLHKGK
jgi:type I restriction enzyme M protein